MLTPDVLIRSDATISSRANAIVLAARSNSSRSRRITSAFQAIQRRARTTYANHGSVDLLPHHGNVLISGSSGIGKSTLAPALTERMAEKGFLRLRSGRRL